MILYCEHCEFMLKGSGPWWYRKADEVHVEAAACLTCMGVPVYRYSFDCS